MSVRIVDVCEITKPISSPIRNAYIDFTKMTTSLVAVVTDAVRDGKRVVGYGSIPMAATGRRFDPRALCARLKEADPKSLLDADGSNLDPDKVWAAMMSNEKPAVMASARSRSAPSTMAVWDTVAKIAGKPLFRCSPSATAQGQSARVRLCRRRAIIIPARICSRCAAKCAAISTAATTS